MNYLMPFSPDRLKMVHGKMPGNFLKTLVLKMGQDQINKRLYAQVD